MTDVLAARQRVRLIIDNDFSGDPDGLYQLAHHVLSTSVEIRFVIGSHLPVGDPFTRSETSAADGAARGRALLDLIGSEVEVVAGSNAAMNGVDEPVVSEAVERIIAEAMRDDPRPLFVACGGSLTEIASALVREPRIAERLTVVWIGGAETGQPGVPAWPTDEVEYNLKGDIAAASVVFNRSEVALWQVPRNAYRQCLMSLDELELRVRPHGALGAELHAALWKVISEIAALGLPAGEVFCMGDSPLVLLTALQSPFNPEPSSSHYVLMPAPAIGPDGQVDRMESGRLIRVYTQLDVRLMFEDFYAKLQLNAAAST